MTPRRGLLLLACAAATLASTAGCRQDPPPKAAPSERVVYRVVDTSTQPERVTTVVVDSAPPYLGRTVTREGPPPGGTSLGGAAWDRDRQYLVQPDGAAAVVQPVAPGPSGVTTYLQVALAAAEHHALVRRAGAGSVAGRACTRWLSKEPLDGSPLAAATATDRTLSCVDDRGRLLEDVWTLGGRVVRTRTAVSVGDGPPLAGTGLLQGRTPRPAQESQLRERVQAKPAATLAGAFGIAVPPAPAGFALDASTAFITLDQGGETRTEGIVFSYRAGSRVVVLRLEQGLGFRLADPTGGVPVTLPGGAPARLSALPTGLRLQRAARPGRLVTVVAALDETELLSWAGALRLA